MVQSHIAEEDPASPILDKVPEDLAGQLPVLRSEGEEHIKLSPSF